ncbi:MAG: hypothetical protein IKF78_16140 [Atopobiaceae bacterium]|nr:hypothetical protein [Atopobiaceae bacterium]
MSATDTIRAMLDERGVEWSATDTYRLLVTSWNDASGHSWAFMEHRDGSFSKLTAYHLTPEQAIEATLGSVENAELRKELAVTNQLFETLNDANDRLIYENMKLRELVRDMWENGMCECDERGACAECEYHFPEHMRELGVEI